MTREQAKRILLLYRSQKLDASAEGMREALQQAEEDPILKAWLRQNEEFYTRTATVLRSIKPPGNLKSRILKQHKIVPLWKRRSFIISAAASLAAAAGGLALLVERTSNQKWAHFEQRMLGYAVRSYAMDIITPEQQEVRRYLALKGAPADFKLPPGLQDLPVKGGAGLLWENRPVAMICFEINNETAYLFVVNTNNDDEGKNIKGVQAAPFYNLTRAIWSGEGRVYLIAAKASEEELKRLVAG